MIDKLLLSYILRGIQFGFSILGLGLSAGIISTYKGNDNNANLVLVTSIFSIVVIAALFILPRYVNIISAGIVWVSEFVLTVLWLSSFAVMANDYGGGSCTDPLIAYVYGTQSTVACQCGQALIAFGVLQWLVFCGTLGLLIHFTIIPIIRSSSFEATFQPDHSFVPGYIFLDEIPLDHTNPTNGQEEDLEQKGGLTPEDIPHEDLHEDLHENPQEAVDAHLDAKSPAA